MEGVADDAAEGWDVWAGERSQAARVKMKATMSEVVRERDIIFLQIVGLVVGFYARRGIWNRAHWAKRKAFRRGSEGR